MTRWEKVVKLMEQGGLGIGSLRVCTEALLAKQFFMEPDALWYKAIVCRNGLHPSKWSFSLFQ